MSKTNKLAPAKDWRNRNLEDWTVLSFTEYMRDRHRELFGCEYAPMRSWGFEQGHLGNLIGTRTKPRTVSNEIVKRFIDEGFETYKPTRDYPGTNFGFIYAYRRNILQRLEAEERAKVSEEKAIESADDLEDLAGWL